jgi:hypothetical protein
MPTGDTDIFYLIINVLRILSLDRRGFGVRKLALPDAEDSATRRILDA